MEALATQRYAERARERKHMAAVADANARTLSLSLADSHKQMREANAILKHKIKAILDAEALLETKHALTSFSLE